LSGYGFFGGGGFGGLTGFGEEPGLTPVGFGFAPMTYLQLLQL